MNKFEEHHDDWWFIKVHGDKGVTGRSYFYNLYKPLLEKGEPCTFSQNVNKGNGRGSSDAPQHDDPIKKRKNKKFVPPRFDIEELFNFDYNDMFNSVPNKKFDNLNNIIFNHDYYSKEDKKLYERYVNIYDEWKSNGNLEKVNDFVQRLSSYIWKNKLNTENKVGGGVICAIAIMISDYIRTGTLNTNLEEINKLDIDELNTEMNKFCLFLLCQVITTKHHYVNLHVNGISVKKLFIICYMRHRVTLKDYKSKNILPSFYKEEDGSISFYLY